MAASEPLPRPPGDACPHEAGTPGVLVIAAPIASHDVPGLCQRARATLQENAAERLDCNVQALSCADAGTLEALARVALTARRLGRGITLHDAPPELRELLVFAGLGDAVPCAPDSAVQVRR